MTINGYGTFAGCGNLRTVNLNNVDIENATNTFYLCSKLTTVTGANTLESIPQSMFSDCTSLRYIDISEATSIGHSAFAGCNKLEFIRVGTELETIVDNAFKKHGPNATLVPMDLTVHCTGSEETSGENLEKLFTQDVCNATFEYDCTDEKWNSIVSQSQTVVPDAGNALARYLLDLRL